VGVITAIGPMHLERLGSIEAIVAAKGELLDALPPDGRFVTNADDPRCVELAERAHVPVTLFGIESGSAQVVARDVRLSGGRTTFQLHLDGPHSPPVPVSAGLLGRHNVSNLLAAAAVGHVLGISPERIAAGLGSVEAPPHRLQPIHNRRASIVVIDDAYNSNPEGAAAALDVLRDHPASRRLLVTPGMVELGELEVELNRRFGEHAATVCDLAILVGPTRTAPIREGLVASGMHSTSVHVVRDIAEATTLLGRLTRAGDVVLFENDLPDTYAEADGGASA
jgi:UDP-N-acetylmuramoyl-tripeptide--D-alanyl-D-alanine ligase